MKKLLLIALLALAPLAHAADVAISALPNASTPLTGTETFPLVQGTTTSKVTANGITNRSIAPTAITGTPTYTLTNGTGLPAAGVVGTAAILGANTFTGLQTLAVENGLTAFAGGGKASATALSATKNYHRITTVATVTDSILLPAAGVGDARFVINSGAKAMQVFGAGTDTINGVATGTGILHGAGMGAWYVCTSAGAWTTSSVAVVNFGALTALDNTFVVENSTAGYPRLKLGSPSGLVTAILDSYNYVFALASGGTMGFSSASTITGISMDTGVSRNAAGVLEANNGTPGTFRDWKLRNTITTAVNATAAAAPTIASATTIAPTVAISFVSGTTTISTITAPSPISAGGGQITIIPTGLWVTDTGGNIALATTAVVNKALILTYDVTTTKWYPSY